MQIQWEDLGWLAAAIRRVARGTQGWIHAQPHTEAPPPVNLPGWGCGDVPVFLTGAGGCWQRIKKKVCLVQKRIYSIFCFSWAVSAVGIPVELKPNFKAVVFFFLAEALWAWCSQHSHSPPRKPSDSDIARCVESAGLIKLIQCQAHLIFLLNKELNKIWDSNVLKVWVPKIRPRASAHLLALLGSHSSISGFIAQHSVLH